MSSFSGKDMVETNGQSSSSNSSHDSSNTDVSMVTSLAKDIQEKANLHVDNSQIMKGGEAAQAADFANYFISYAYLYHQKQMLTDHKRMEAYHSAISRNDSTFKDKIVMDVGTGTGVLSVWSAKAGAKKVYAVEFTDMAKHAREVVDKNGVSDIVNVIQGSAEEVEVNEGKVDILVSEWMGYFLLRESMTDSLLRVRDKYLKEDGHMFPSHSTMFWGLITDEEERLYKKGDYIKTLQDWSSFTAETKAKYDIDLTCLSRQYDEEQKQYFLLSSCWAELHGDQVIAPPVIVHDIDMKTCTFSDVQGFKDIPFCFEATYPVTCSGFAGWFTNGFKGNGDVELTFQNELSTAPENGYTHWGQQVFYLEDCAHLSAGDTIEGTLSMYRQKINERLYYVEGNFHINQAGKPPKFYNIVWEMP